MRILVSGGGTAGHINPAIAIAKRMQREYGAEILFIGKKGGMEQTLVPKEGFEIASIEVEGLIRKLTPKNIAVAVKYVKAIGTAKQIIRDFAPDVVVGTGGYVCAPVMRAAHSLRIPVVVHEQNVFPGMTVKMASRFADCVAISFDDTVNYIKNEDAKKVCVLTGNPLRENMTELTYKEAREKLGIDDRPFIVTVGGSLGAKTINDALVELIDRLDVSKVRILGGTGERFYEEVKNRIDPEKLRDNIAVVPYIYNMDVVLPAADLVIARAGAITVSELCALGRPSLLIPSPNVTHNHQEYNANSIAEKGAAIMIPERDISGTIISDTVEKLIFDEYKLSEMSDCASKLAIIDGTKRICDIVAGFAKE